MAVFPMFKFKLVHAANDEKAFWFNVNGISDFWLATTMTAIKPFVCTRERKYKNVHDLFSFQATH